MIKGLLLTGILFFGGANYEEEIPQVESSEEIIIEDTESESVEDVDLLDEQIDKLLENNEVKAKISEAVEEKLKSVIGTYTDETTANNIVGWIINVLSMAVIVALFIASIKRKGGISADEVKEILSGEIKNEEIKKDLAKVKEDLANKLDIVVKALVLAQDKTATSKLALLDLLKTEKNEAVVEQVKEVVEEGIKAKDEALEVVKEDYKEIF